MFEVHSPQKKVIRILSPARLVTISINSNANMLPNTIQKIQSPRSIQTSNTEHVTKLSSNYNSPRNNISTGSNCSISHHQIAQQRVRTTKIFKSPKFKSNEQAQIRLTNPLTENVNIINYGPIQVYCVSPKLGEKRQKDQHKSKTSKFMRQQNMQQSQYTQNYENCNTSQSLTIEQNPGQIKDRYYDESQQTSCFSQQQYTIAFKNVETPFLNHPQNSIMNTSLYSNYKKPGTIKKVQPFSVKQVNFSEKNMILEQGIFKISQRSVGNTSVQQQKLKILKQKPWRSAFILSICLLSLLVIAILLVLS